MGLIDADKLIATLLEEIPMAENTNIFKEMIENQPIVYDVDKVVEQLKDMKSLYQRLLELKDRDCHKYAFKIEALSDAIEIVKAGGIDGKSK